MSARKIGGLYIGITSEFMAEPFWQERDGHNWRDQAFSRLGLYTSRDGRRWQRVGGPGPWVDTGESGRPGLRVRVLHPRGDARTRRSHCDPLQRQSAEAELAAKRAADTALSARGVRAPATGVEGAARRFRASLKSGGRSTAWSCAKTAGPVSSQPTRPAGS